MKELLKKLESAKRFIKESGIKKEGWNDYSQYAYFTPDQIENLVSRACEDNGLITTFDLIRNELGIYGVLTIYDISSGNNLKLQMATDIPQITATNTAQQLGGCVTYTERYLKMSVFGITDNRLDFDTTENTKKTTIKETTKSGGKMTWPQLLNALDAGYDEIGANDIFLQVIEDAGYDIEGVYNIKEKDLQKEVYHKLNNKLKSLKGIK